MYRWSYIKSKVISILNGNLVNKSLKVLLIRCLGVIFFFSLSLYLTNYYPPQIVGKYDFVRSLLMVLGGLCLLGTNQSIIYYSGLLKAKKSLGSLSKIYLKMIVIIVTISVFLLLIVSLLDNSFLNTFFDKPEASKLIYKVVLALSFYGFTLLNIDMLRALNKTMLSELFRNIFRHLPFFIFIIFFKNLYTFLIEAYLFSFAIIALISFVIVFKTLSIQNEPILIKNLGFNKIIKQSYPMAISALSYFLMQSIDVLLLSKFESFKTVAFYSVAVKLSTVTALALLSVNIIVAPKIAEIYNSSDKKELRKLVKNSARLILAISLPALSILAIFSSFALGLFGENYKIAQNALLILLFGQLFNSLCGPVAIYMNMTGKQNKLQRILIFGLVLNLVLNLIFIPKYGMLGAATSTALSMIIWNLIATIYTYKKDKIKTFIS